VAEGAAPPSKFSDKENVAWKADLPGRGVSGPIVVSGKVFVTSASGARRDRLHVLCFDCKTGRLEWEREYWATGRTFCHPTSSVAAPTPCSDGKHIYAFYSSNDLVCLDLDGNLKWLRGLTHDHPTAANDVGMSSSPVVVGETVIVQVESYGDSFVAGINTRNGETRWKIPRPQAFNWVSPSVLRGKTAADDSVILQSGKTVEAVRPETGETIWRHEIACTNIPSTTSDGETLFVPAEGLTAFRGAPGSAARKLLWSQNRLGPGSASPVARDGKVYVLRGTVLVCGDAETGEVLWQVRVRGQRFWATPVLVDKHLYLASAEGLVQVVDVSGKGKIIGESDAAEPIYGTPAVADGGLYLRTDKRLWKIGK
jgi:outer membrane protein assembly factor BamB